MHKVGFVYDDVMLKHDPPPWHPERKARLVCILETLKNSGVWGRLICINPQKASFEDIALVHTPEYIEKIKTFGEGCLDPDTYIGSCLWPCPEAR
ncbi:MAG: hypothetical protein M1508_07125 [Nitrospirae bacterium]|nr:hypothetical protein [Nitrospirota bacterium]MCL5422427.1 hypothetical protein [Nitrospirota bacterium]